MGRGKGREGGEGGGREVEGGKWRDGLFFFAAASLFLFI